MVTALEQCVWDACLVIRESEFGEILRRARRRSNGPGSLEELTGWGHPDELVNWELSSDPAIQRTATAQVYMDISKEPLPPGSDGWLEWTAKASLAIRRMAAKCWAGTPSDVRMIFIDSDNVMPPGLHGEIAELRFDQRGIPALKFAGLDSPPVREAIDCMCRSVRSSSLALKARDAAKTIQQNPAFLLRLALVARELSPSFLTINAGETGEQAFARMRTTAFRAYDDFPDLRDLVLVLRSFNKLVTRVIWTVLGVAELFEPPHIAITSSPVQIESKGGRRHLVITTGSYIAPLLRTTHPVWIDSGTPIDGLYFVNRLTSAFSGRSEVDLGLTAFL